MIGVDTIAKATIISSLEVIKFHQTRAQRLVKNIIQKVGT